MCLRGEKTFVMVLDHEDPSGSCMTSFSPMSSIFYLIHHFVQKNSLFCVLLLLLILTSQFQISTDVYKFYYKMVVHACKFSEFNNVISKQNCIVRYRFFNLMAPEVADRVNFLEIYFYSKSMKNGNIVLNLV